MAFRKQGSASKWLFWSSFGLILYTYLIFPALVVLRAVLESRKLNTDADNRASASSPDDPSLPTVSFIVAAYNEESVIAGKIANSLSSEYPQELIEVIIASDGSDDGTNDIVASYPSKQVKLLALSRQGKNRTINQAVSQAGGEILVFTDADCMLSPEALHNLVAPFADPGIGGVAGTYRYVNDDQGAEGERAYWKFDQKLKELQSNGGDLVGATGHIYAIRHNLFRQVPQGVTDDSFISRSVIGSHKRLVFEPKAVAYGPIADRSGEFRRKVRITTRGLKVVWEQRYLLNPFEFGFYSLQLFSHKVLRRLVFIPMIITQATALMLWRRSWFYKAAAIGQFGIHISAALGFALNNTRLGKSRLLSFPYYLDMTNLASMVAVWNMLKGESRDVWEAERVIADQDSSNSG